MNKNKKQIKRSCKPLTSRERIDVEREYRHGASITSIAKEIDGTEINNCLQLIKFR